MTQPTNKRGEHLRAALSLAASGVPVLPLGAAVEIDAIVAIKPD